MVEEEELGARPTTGTCASGDLLETIRNETEVCLVHLIGALTLGVSQDSNHDFHLSFYTLPADTSFSIDPTKQARQLLIVYSNIFFLLFYLMSSCFPAHLRENVDLNS